MNRVLLSAVCAALLATSLPAQESAADPQALQQEIFGNMEKLYEGDGDALQPLLKSLNTFLTQGEPGPQQLRVAMFATRILEATGEYKAAQDMMRGVKTRFAKADKDLADAATEFYDQMSKRYAILGSPLKIEAKLSDGEALDWSKYQGKVVLVDFWATWCKPCVEELPNLQKLHESYHKHGFEILGVNADENVNKFKTFVHERQLPWPNIAGKESEKLIEQFNVDVFPTTFLVGRDGKVAYINLRGPWLKSRLAALMPEATKNAGGTSSGE